MENERINILLIDDNVMLSFLLKKILEYHDFNVQLFNCSVSALEHAKKNKADIVICDVYMPKMNGFEFCTAFKEFNYWEVPFIFLSATKLDEDVRKGMNLGADDFLLKPIKTKDLLETIHSQLKKKEKVVQKFRLMERSLKTEIAQKDESLKREASILSHSIRGPLSTLMSVVNVLEDDDFQDNKEELIKEIKPLAEKLDQAIRDNVQQLNEATY